MGVVARRPRRLRGLGVFWVVGLAILGGVIPNVFALGGLGNISVRAASQRAGEVETWTIEFEAPVAGIVDAHRLVWSMADSFDLENVECDLEGSSGTTTSVTGQTVLCKVGEGGHWYAQGQTMTWTFANIRAPTWAHTPSAFMIDYQNPAGATVGEDNTRTATIIANRLQSVTASLADDATGVSTTLTYGFKTKNPSTGDVRFVLPSGFELRDDASCSIAGLTGPTLTRLRATEGVCGLNGAVLWETTTYSMAIAGVKNAPYALSYTAPTLQTRNGAGLLQDTASNLALSLEPRAFAQEPIATPGTLEAGATTWWHFDLAFSNPLPAGDYLSIFFPGGFDFNEGGTTRFDVLSGSTATFEPVTVDGQRLYSKLAGGASLAGGTRLVVNVTHLGNPLPLRAPGDPLGPESIQFIVDTADDVSAAVQSIYDVVDGLLFPCDPDTEPCDCPDEGCTPEPCADPTDDSSECCEANHNCPPPPTCEPAQQCPEPPTVTLTKTAPVGADGGGGAAPPGAGSSLLEFFGGASGTSGALLLVLLSMVAVAGIAGGGYYVYRHRQNASVKPAAKAPSPSERKSVLEPPRKP